MNANIYFEVCSLGVQSSDVAVAEVSFDTKDQTTAAIEKANEAAGGAKKVNAKLNGTIVSVTDRNGSESSVDLVGSMEYELEGREDVGTTDEGNLAIIGESEESVIDVIGYKDFAKSVFVYDSTTAEVVNHPTYTYLKSTKKYKVRSGQKIAVDNLLCANGVYGLVKYDAVGNIIGGEKSGGSAEDMLRLYVVEDGVCYVRFTAYTLNTANLRNVRIAIAEDLDCKKYDPYIDVKTITHDSGGDTDMNYNAFVNTIVFDDVLYLFYMKGKNHTDVESAKIVYKFSLDGGDTWSSERDLLTNVSSCVPNSLQRGVHGAFNYLCCFEDDGKLYGIGDYRYEYGSGTYKRDICYRFGKGEDNTLTIEKKVVAPVAGGSPVSMYYKPYTAGGNPSSMISSNVLVEDGWMYWVQYNGYNMYLQKMDISVIDNESEPSASNCGLVYAWVSNDNYYYTESVLIKSGGVLYCMARRGFIDEDRTNKVMGNKLFYSKDMGETWTYWKDTIPLDKPFALALEGRSDYLLVGRCKNPNWMGVTYSTTMNLVGANMDIKMKGQNYNLGGVDTRDCGYESAEIVDGNVLIFYYCATAGHNATIADIKMSKISLSNIY